MSKPGNKRFSLILLTVICLIIVMFFVSLTVGEFKLTVSDVLKVILQMDPSPRDELVIFDFRLPRIVIAGAVGLGLGIAGAAIQGITRNGLADPGILGINAGAGAAIVIFLFLFQGQTNLTGWVAIMVQPLFGLVGGLGAALIIYLISWQNGKLDPQRLLLTGIAIGTGFGALSLFISLKMKSSDFEMATVWISGSIFNANWLYIASIIPWLILLIPIILRKAALLDFFQLEETSMKTLGISVEKEKSIILLASIGIVSACVAVSGGISFIGLMSPHIARRLVGIQHRHILPVCGAIGMLLVITSDFIAKTAFAPIELPVGIIISIIGVPYFIYLLIKEKS